LQAVIRPVSEFLFVHLCHVRCCFALMGRGVIALARAPP